MDEKELLEQLWKEAKELPPLKEYFLSEYNATTDDEARAMIIESLLGWASMRQWGWDALVELVTELIDRDEPIPPQILKEFVRPKIQGKLKPPSERRDPWRPFRDDDKGAQIRWFVRKLEKEHNYSATKARKAVAGTVNNSYETIRTICDDRVRVRTKKS